MTPSGTQALIIVSSYPPVPPDHSFDITPRQNNFQNSTQNRKADMLCIEIFLDSQD